jgi:hypothetical protein
MKASYTLRTLSAFLLPLTLLLSSCGDKKKQDDPAPQAHVVRVHYVAQNVANLGPQVAAGSISPSGATTSYFSEVPANSMDITHDPWTVASGDDFSVIIAFANVRGTQRAPAGSRIVAEILVDGQVRKTAVIDETTAPGSDYVSARATIRASEW